MKAAFDLLASLEAVFPPDEGTSHSLTTRGEKLAVGLLVGGRWHSFLLDDKDMDRPVDELVNEIALLMKQNHA